MRYDILTIFPHIFDSYFNESILKRAQGAGKIEIVAHDIREYATDKHKTTDDIPYGGGAGMVMKVEPIYRAVRAIQQLTVDNLPLTAREEGNLQNKMLNVECFLPPLRLGDSAPPLGQGRGSNVKRQLSKVRVILFSAKGKRFTQRDAERLAKYDRLILICGRYEGVDERVAEHIADEEISIGEYVLTGGEIPAMVLVDAVTRLLPDVLGNAESLREESFSVSEKVQGESEKEEGKGARRKAQDANKENGLDNDMSSNLQAPSSKFLEYPQYTRPEEFNGWKVPEVLLSGHHAEILKWRRKKQGNEK